MTRGLGKYRVEHVEERPRGWRVRTKLSGRHVLRVGFPPGPRRRGAGRLLEVLHPREENNPSCPVTARAKSNPESLIVFGLGNPDRDVLRKRLKTAQARFDAISQKQTELRRRLKPQHGEKYILTPEWSALEPESDAAYKALESAKRAMNPGRKGKSKRKNAVRMQIELDPSRHQYRASMKHPSGGSWLYAWGHTKKQAAAALRDEWRKARKNPPALSSSDISALTKLWHTARIAGANTFGERVTWAAKEWDKAHPGQRMRAYKYLSSAMRGYGNPAGAWRVSTYQLVAGTGRPIRKATKVTAPDGREIKFIEKMSKRSAIAQAKHHLGIANPRPRRRRHNPVSETEQAVKLFEIFHGKDPVKIVDKHVSAAMRKDYTALGKLVAVGLEDGGYGEREIAAKWDKCDHISFSGDGVTLASSPDGRQLYAIGGNQNLNDCLGKFAGVDPAKDFIDLGEVVFVVYEARKVHDNFEPVEYVHKFGGHGNTRPGWFYDRLKQSVFFIGGEYFIDVDAKISPGIEG